MQKKTMSPAKELSTKVKRMKIQKLTTDDLIKVTGGCNDTRDCTGPGGKTCIAYILRDM